MRKDRLQSQMLRGAVQSAMSQEDDTMDPGRFSHRLITICLVHQGGRLLSMSG